MDKKITSSVVLASFATTQFGLLNVSAENSDSSEATVHEGKDVSEGNELHGKLGAQGPEKLEDVEDVEKIEKKIDALEKSSGSEPVTYSKVVDSLVAADNEESADLKPVDDVAKIENSANAAADIKVGENKVAEKGLNLSEPVPSQSKQKNISTFGKLKSYLGNLFSSSEKKENKIEDRKTENRNSKTGTKKSKTKKSSATKNGKTKVNTEKLRKPEGKTKTQPGPQNIPAATGKEIKKDNQQNKASGKKISKSSKLFNFAPSKEAKMFLGAAGVLGSAYAADKLADSLKYGGKKSNSVPADAVSTKASPSESKSVVPGGELISDVGDGLKNGTISYPLKFVFVADRKVRKTIGDCLDSFSKNNVGDLLNCKGDGFNDFSKAVKDLNLGSLSADDLLGKNRKYFIEALKKLSITDKEVDALLNEKNIDKLKNMLQQAGLSAEATESLLGKNLKKFSKRLGVAASKSDGIYAILEKNFGNFDGEIKDAGLPLEAVKYVGRLVLSIPDSFLFWPKLTIWLWRKLSESGVGTETKIVAALAFAAFYAYKYIWSSYKIYKACMEYAKDGGMNLSKIRKFLFTNGHIQKLSYDIWLLRHVLRPLLATTFTEKNDDDKEKTEKKDKDWLDKIGDKISPLAKPAKVALDILWRLTPISVGWGLFTDWLPSLRKGASRLEQEATEEWKNLDLGKQEKEKAEKAEKKKKAKEQAKNGRDAKMQEEVNKRLDKEDEFLKIFISDFEELQKKYLDLKDLLKKGGIKFDENGNIKNREQVTINQEPKVKLLSEYRDILKAVEVVYNGKDKLNKNVKSTLMLYLRSRHKVTGEEFLSYIEDKIESEIPLKLTGKNSEQSVERIKKDIQAEEEARKKGMTAKNKVNRKKTRFISNMGKEFGKNFEDIASGLESADEGSGL